MAGNTYQEDPLYYILKAKAQLGCSDGWLAVKASICDDMLYSISLSMLLQGQELITSSFLSIILAVGVSNVGRNWQRDTTVLEESVTTVISVRV
jgi:hypothetical protein